MSFKCEETVNISLERYHKLLSLVDELDNLKRIRHDEKHALFKLFGDKLVFKTPEKEELKAYIINDPSRGNI